MSDLFWLSDHQFVRMRPHFPLSHGARRVNDRRVISGIIFVLKNGLHWRDSPAEYGPQKTLYNRLSGGAALEFLIVFSAAWLLRMANLTP